MYLESIVASLLIGILVGLGGAFLYRRVFVTSLSFEADTQLMEPDAPHKESLASQVCIWDPHSCMNALNRLTMSASGDQEDTLFAVAEHMKFLALLIRSDGWCSIEHMTEWLNAWLELHYVLHSGSSRPQVKITVPDGTTKIDTRPIGHLMLSHVAHAGPVASLSFTFSVVPPSEYSQLLEDELGYLWLNCVLVGDSQDRADATGKIIGSRPQKEFSTRCLALHRARQ